MRKITVVAQAPYPVALPNGRHVAPGEVAKDVDADAITDELALGFLREVAPSIEEKTPQKTERTPAPKRADENKDQE